MTNTTYGVDFINLIVDTQNGIKNLLDKELKFDDTVDSWFFMSTPWPMLSILTVYLLFVLKLGPELMQNREPFKIKYIMMIYNLIQTIYNMYIVSHIFRVPGIASYLYTNACHPVGNDDEFNFLFKVYYEQSWHFFISKLLDLFDTVFFVLRKKQTHVSFLHVYHHVNMVITIWTFLKFIKCHQGVPCGILNATVHSIMYSYYFLSAFGPKMQKYLWWKKYLTRLQIIQFIIGLAYGTSLFIYDCTFPRLFSFYMILDVSLFLYLFLKFYKKTYNTNKKSQ
ncbi:ELO family, conserved site,ELO family [Cinara cedri]|uniref:Elongation of very long chain fatty acids protein n=1 Tax=Cinara cedri TaxID=506608 RepID=A0A5E4M774_9HEMI|nr:ELO family, conserved site,ELO family [Cinara cedri]